MPGKAQEIHFSQLALARIIFDLLDRHGKLLSLARMDPHFVCDNLNIL